MTESPDLSDLDDATLAATLAEQAGRILLAMRDDVDTTGKALGDAGDMTANRYLCQALSAHRPDDGLLSEERKDTPERLGKSRVWIVDPVDGTREYGERRSDWAVHVALSIDGNPALGAVALPEAGLVLRSDSPIPLSAPPETPRIVVSRTRPVPEVPFVAERMGAQIVPMGSAGAKAMAVVGGEAEIYLHSGGQYEWDSCAPVAVAMAHGLHCSRIDGSPLVYNRTDTFMPDLLICRPRWADTVLELVARMDADRAS